jgi:uncharacterized membrane protein YsdA (DUF1294 family)
MWPIVRSIGLVFIGVVIAMTIFIAGQVVNALVFMKGVDIRDDSAVRDAIPNLPVTAFVTLLLIYFVGTFCGAWVAARLTRHRWFASPWPMAHAMMVGLVLLIAGLPDIFSLPHPPWFFIGYFTVFPLGAYLAGWLVMAGKQTLSTSA